jgi:hypothetical protein
MSLKIATGSNKIVFDLSCGKRYISWNSWGCKKTWKIISKNRKSFK